jgi:ATP/ADP translocase
MAKGVKHYFKTTGKEHKGATHKDAKGKVMSGAKHTASSKYLVHMSDLSATAKKKAKA